jgi:hypothetical protein
MRFDVLQNHPHESFPPYPLQHPFSHENGRHLAIIGHINPDIRLGTEKTQCFHHRGAADRSSPTDDSRVLDRRNLEFSKTEANRGQVRATCGLTNSSQQVFVSERRDGAASFWERILHG